MAVLRLGLYIGDAHFGVPAAGTLGFGGEGHVQEILTTSSVHRIDLAFAP